MTEFMNNVNNKQSSFSTMSSFYAPKINSNQATPTTQAQKPDTVDVNNKESINKDKKKKIITYSAIAAGIGLAILTFFKRKQIGDFFSGLFKKKPKNPPVQPDTPRSPSGSKPPSTPPKGTDLGGNTPPSTNIGGKIVPEIPTSKLPTLDEFQKLEKEDMPALVSKFAKGTREEKESLLDLYTTLDKKHASLLETNPERLSLGKKLYVLEKQMTEQNISFVQKAPQTFASETDKIKYLQKTLSRADINEASAMDALSVFEKYGGRYEYKAGERIKYDENGMTDLYVTITRVMDKFDPPSADKVMNKYLDIFNKCARIDGDHRDTRFLERFMTHNADKMSESTVGKLIDTLKKYSFESNQAWYARAYFLKSEFTKRSPEELKRIDIKVKELEEIVKDMPRVNPTKPKGMSN